MQYTTDNPVAQLRDAMRQIVDCEPEWQEPGIFDFEPIIENGQTNATA